VALAVPLSAPSSAQDVDRRPAAERAKRRVEVVAVGDIACRPGARVTATRCHYAATAKLVRRIDPARVLGLGDMSNHDGSWPDYRDSYHPTWGKLRAVTDPVPGNHDYQTSGAAGYYRYFASRQPGPPGYYTRRYGAWRVYLLNSNCGEIDCEEQLRWLERKLSRDTRRCTMITMHHPRYSSGGLDMGGRIPRFARIAYRHGVDVVLAGHSHNYERFRRMDHKGQRAKDGFIQFVVGTGGSSLWQPTDVQPGSAYRDGTSFGALRLVLRPKSFTYKFKTVDGTTPDRGSRRCV
jgi:3',5'-cyclic AMP phosphodiesterase CpdA